VIYKVATANIDSRWESETLYHDRRGELGAQRLSVIVSIYISVCVTLVMNTAVVCYVFKKI